MSLLPIANGKVAFDSTAVGAPDAFNAGIRYSPTGEAKCTTDAGTFFNQGIPTSADGRVSVVDASAGLPVGTTFSNGLPISGNKLCVSSNAVSVVSSGITFDAAGAIAAAGFTPSVSQFALLPASGVPTYTVTQTALNSAGISYSVPGSVLNSAGTAYTPI